MKRSFLAAAIIRAGFAWGFLMAAGCGDSLFYIVGEDADGAAEELDDTLVDDSAAETPVPDVLQDPEIAPDPDAAADPDLVPDPIDETPGACSGHGTPYTWPSGTFCACAAGYSASSSAGSDCVPTSTVCTGGTLPEPIDVNGDGAGETLFDPSPLECQMYELVNYTRASHDPEGSTECHQPLMYNLEWSAHGRNHSFQMSERSGLFHDDYPRGQNCAYGCDPACEMDMYMNWAGEDHCPAYSHHCNIMSCDYGQIGVGYWTPEAGDCNTQNFL